MLCVVCCSLFYDGRLLLRVVDAVVNCCSSYAVGGLLLAAGRLLLAVVRLWSV